MFITSFHTLEINNCLQTMSLGLKVGPKLKQGCGQDDAMWDKL